MLSSVGSLHRVDKLMAMVDRLEVLIKSSHLSARGLSAAVVAELAAGT